MLDNTLNYLPITPSLFVILAQVMDPSGRFLRAFGSQGTADGKFNYPWGITTDALGFIYVCDKENHRVQVTRVKLLLVVSLAISM